MAGKSEADLIPVPKIPKPKKEDPEDVAWALSTAEAMWNRAENADAIKWIRRAAEAASEAENDDRALELAKAAADLASMLVKVEGNPSEMPPPPEPAPNTLQSRGPTPTGAPPRAASAAPPAPAAPKIPTAPPAPKIGGASSAPAPVIATSRSPNVPARPASAPAGKPGSVSPPAPTPARISGKPPAPPRAAPPQAALPKVQPKSDRRGRRSQPGLSEEAKRAAEAAIIARAGGEQEVTKPISAPPPKRAAVANEARRRRSRPAAEEVAPPPAPSSTAQLSAQTEESAAPVTGEGSRADEIDEWPTQALKNDELPDYDDRTRVGAAPYEGDARRVIEPSTADMKPSQAVRVVVWRTPDGVHVAPAGTTVAAITIDALLVALDPNADLTSWLKG
jgi:hypothetical protein